MKAFVNLFEQRIRGVRLIEAVGFALAMAMIFWVCLSKVREGEDIRRMNELDAQIAAEKSAVGTLKIQVARLERPERLEALAKGVLNMQPLSSSHEADIDSIAEISRTSSMPVVSSATPAAAVAATTPQDELITPQEQPARPAPATKLEIVVKP